MCIIYIYPTFIVNIWATVNIWYIAPSHQFLKSVLLFFRFWYISKCYRFLKSVLSFSKPQLNFQKIKMSRILRLSINLNFGCSSYVNIPNDWEIPGNFFWMYHPVFLVFSSRPKTSKRGKSNTVLKQK